MFKYAFTVFDQDGSGNITIEELNFAFFGNKVNKENLLIIQKMMDEVDDDKNGQIEFQEFCKMMRAIMN